MPADKQSYEEFLLLDGIAKKSRVALGQSFGNEYHFPSGRRQKGRLDNKFKALKSQFNLASGGARFSVGPAGTLPEQVIILEIVGDIIDFLNAAQKIEGLDFQFELNADEIQSSDDFYDSKKSETDHTLTTKMFLILTNQKALKKILQMWSAWKRAPNKNFARGYGKWKDLFKRLYDVRVWSDKDRLNETGIISYWQEQVESNKNLIFSEIEFWFSSNESVRANFESNLKIDIEAMGGEIVKSTVIREIRYHGLIIKLPRAKINIFLNDDLGLLKEKSSIMFFRPCAQALVTASEHLSDNTLKFFPSHSPQKSEKCLVLDGFPMENHVTLQPWINVNDLFNFSSMCPPCRSKSWHSRNVIDNPWRGA